MALWVATASNAGAVAVVGTAAGGTVRVRTSSSGLKNTTSEGQGQTTDRGTRQETPGPAPVFADSFRLLKNYGRAARARSTARGLPEGSGGMCIMRHFPGQS